MLCEVGVLISPRGLYSICILTLIEGDDPDQPLEDARSRPRNVQVADRGEEEGRGQQRLFGGVGRGLLLRHKIVNSRRRPESMLAKQ